MSQFLTFLVIALVALGALLLFWQKSASHKRQSLPSGLQLGPIRHETLPQPLVERIRRLEPVFAEVYPRSHEEWLDGFKRDAEPEVEVAMWEVMASAYSRFTEGRRWSLDAKEEAFGLLVLRSAVDEETTLRGAKLRHLTRAEAGELVSMYSLPPQPVKVSR